MSNPYEDHADGLAELQDELGADCPQMLWNESLWPVLPGGARLAKELSTGGFSLDSDIQLTVLMGQFGANLPVSPQNFNYPGKDGKLYKITSVTPAPGQFQMRINANDAEQSL
jgi:hypothetical protein